MGSARHVGSDPRTPVVLVGQVAERRQSGVEDRRGVVRELGTGVLGDLDAVVRDVEGCDELGGLGEVRDAGLDERGDLLEAGQLAERGVSPSTPSRWRKGSRREVKSPSSSARRWTPLIQSSFLRSKIGPTGLTSRQSKRAENSSKVNTSTSLPSPSWAGGYASRPRKFTRASGR